MRSGQAARRGYIVIAPHWSRKNQSDYEYSFRSHAAVLYSLRDAMRRTSIDSDRVFLTGHSLGGALAVLTAAWLKHEGIVTPRGVFTYGAPRTGDDDFSRQYRRTLNAKTWAWQAVGDPVPTMPHLNGKYVHGAKRHLQIRSNGTVDRVELRDEGLDVTDLAAPLQLVIRTATGFVGPHSISRSYLPKIRRLQRRLRD